MPAVYEVITSYLQARGVERVFGLCGGHIQPLWDHLARAGITLVDVRHEGAALHMAQAQGELTGQPGVALVTAGPGFTNALTGLANAQVSGAPMLLLTASPPRPQRGRGAMQEIDQIALAAPLSRRARLVEDPARVVDCLEEAWAAAAGFDGDPGPAMLDFPVDILRATLPDTTLAPARPPQWACAPEAVAQARELIWAAKRPLVISGRGARGAGPQLAAFLEALGCVYLDTAESKGLIPGDHPAFMPSRRGRAMAEADLIITVGRRLDYQLAYGSPAIFPSAQFVRLGDNPAELRGNRQGAAEIYGPVAQALEALTVAGRGKKPALDRAWVEELRAQDQARRAEQERRLRQSPAGKDGAMHPYRLLGAVKDALGPSPVVVADGGDILSFSRQVFSEQTYLDCGPFGCLGVGLPYGIAVALTFPQRPVAVVTGDGSLGFHAMELDTARRLKARVVCVVANNGAWNIERQDQLVNYQGNLVGVDLPDCDYAALARSLGLPAWRVQDPQELPGVLAQAFDQAPALVEAMVTRDAVSPDFLSGLAAVPDRQALAKWDQLEAQDTPAKV